jgi:hypothetical protein
MNSKIYDRFNILVYCACNDIRTMAIPCYQEVLIVVFDSIPKLPTNVIQSQLLMDRSPPSQKSKSFQPA